MKQLSRITQSARYPPRAPSVVVAINSPEPTIDAQRMMPGPIRFIIAPNVRGGSATSSGLSRYGSSTAALGVAVAMGDRRLLYHGPPDKMRIEWDVIGSYLFCLPRRLL